MRQFGFEFTMHIGKMLHLDVYLLMKSPNDHDDDAW
jgi:hypothetical protein